jgi:hypothetical protein
MGSTGSENETMTSFRRNSNEDSDPQRAIKVLLAERTSVSLEGLFSMEFESCLRFYGNLFAVYATEQIHLFGLLHYKLCRMSCGKSEVKMNITLIIFSFFIFVLLSFFTFILAAWKEKYLYVRIVTSTFLRTKL